MFCCLGTYHTPLGDVSHVDYDAKLIHGDVDPGSVIIPLSVPSGSSLRVPRNTALLVHQCY